MLTPYIDGVYLVDFEFHPANGVEGNPPEPVCMVVRNLVSGGWTGIPGPTFLP